MIYYADQNGCTIRLLQTSDNKRYKLSSLRSDEGEIKALINFPYFNTSFGVIGRYQGDVFNNTVDQANFEGNNIVIFKDNSYKIGKFNSWDYQDITNISAGFCPSHVLKRGEELEASPTLSVNMNAKVNRTAICKDDEYHFIAGESIAVLDFIEEIKKKYPDYEFIAVGDGGGSTELIINGKIQNKLQDGSERANYCALAFIKPNQESSDGEEGEEGENKLFTLRLSKDGMKDNPYWYDSNINAGAKDGLYLPNCTTYASGRFSELNGRNMRDIMKNRVGFGNAKDWYANTKLEKGATPRVGSIACFDGSVGHVAIVEKVNDDGTVLVSQSNYEKKKDYNSINYFQTRTYKLEVGKKAKGVGLIFQGYIYAPYIKTAVKRNENKPQVEILADKLRVRKQANGDWQEGIFAPLGLYDILETKEAGAYTWAKLDKDVWIALNDKDGWTKTYTKESIDYKKLYEEEVKKYNELLDKYNILDIKNSNNEAKLSKATLKLEKIGEILNE